ncbi:hypothetical protein F5Y18DRAFT_395224 [Xylariaceae sp. FL1019]|nr:hypothetical protein F5Y18DRAFT_395224 [Xylariaceae sp. FL1019]
MASFDDTSSPSSDAYGGQISQHAPWPFTTPDIQAKFERKHLAPGATINFTDLPRAAWWVPDRDRANLILWNVALFATNAHRPLEQSEADAVAQNTVRSHQWRSLILPTALTVAAAATIAGRKTFRFPFYTPKPKSFNPRAFPSKQWKIAQGDTAVKLWNATRLATYFTLGSLGFNILFSSVQGSTFAANILRDDRLKAVTRAIGENRKQRGTQRGQQQYSRSSTDSESAEQPYQDNTPQGYLDYSQENTWTSSNSPQGNTYTGPPPNQTSSPPAPMKGQSPAREPPSTGTRAQDDDLDLFGNNDASPVAPSSGASNSRQKAQGSPSSMSWEQIRQQARSGSAQWARGDSSGQEQGWAQLRQDTARTTKDDTRRSSEDFSYSQADEDKEKRQYEKDKAQKEFDALVDAEREGKSGSSGGVSGGGWRR